MFTGIIESIGEVRSIVQRGTSKQIEIHSHISSELKVDQSVSHNGVCLTVEATEGDHHAITAIDETLKKSNLRDLEKGDLVNLERAARIGSRLDGHMVQGHIDGTTRCIRKVSLNGSWKFTFKIPQGADHLFIPQGSICINGVSLTIADLKDDHFSVAIIPYTYDHTTFKQLDEGMMVNLEYDIIGKYLHRFSILANKT
ncbi:MAG: riboflavin synthase [Saprospiraceae bacterium]|nr:riboflavin synthase [Saprospiraceae bacterium]